MQDTVTIYADVLFFINLSTDFLCLYITSRIQAIPVKTYRILCASAVGGLYSCFSLTLVELPDILQLMLHIAAAILICLISFGVKRLILRTLFFSATCAVLGGIMCGIYSAAGRGYYAGGGFYVEADPLFVLVFSALCSIGALFYLLTLKKSKGRQAECEFSVDDILFSATLLCDSGCFIRDSLSGYPVIIIASRVLGKKIKITGADSESLEALGKTARFVPVSTVSGTSLLCAFRPDMIKINKKQICAVIAIDTVTQSFGGYDGILPWELGE